MAKKTWLERFFEKVEITEGCWIWRGAMGRNYGVFTFDGKLRVAHRGLWEKIMGPVPAGMELDHLCRNPACVRLDHLEPVTRSENMKRSMPYRSMSGVAAENVAKTHCKAGHPYTEDNIYRIANRPGARYCRDCHKDRSREYARRKRTK